MRKTLKFSTFLLFILIFAIPADARAANDPVVIRMGMVVTPREGVYPHSMISTERHLARLVSEYTNGEVKIELMPGSQHDLSPREMASMVVEGETLQAANLNAFFFPKVPELLIQSIPFLFEGDEHARRFATSEPAAWLAAKVEAAYGVKQLGYLLVASDVAISGVEPVRDLSDFTGKVLKGSRGTNSMFDNVKPARIESMSFAAAARGELATSDIEITVGLLQNSYNQQLHKRFKHATLARNYYNIYYTPIINRDVWEGLTPSQRAGIERAVRDTENAAVSFQRDATDWHWQLLESLGVDMHLLSDTERQQWKAEFQPVIREMAVSGSVDPETTERMIRQIEGLVSDLAWR